MSLIEITPPDFDVSLELAYATPDNFTGMPVYARAICYLHEEAADRLSRACVLAAAQECRLRIFDGFSPTEAQQVLWNHTPDPEFLADPAKGSPHSRGAAVDLTLVDVAGNAPDMGTPFDTFTPLSHHGCTEISQAAQKNRSLLLGLMTAAGWDFYSREWWHYQLFDSRRLPVLSESELEQRLM